jgi:DmsE family decaheme c-type cytochrome
VKSYSQKTVEFGLTEALSTGIPDKPKFRLRKKYLLLAASALLCWTAFGLPQSVKAGDAFTVAGIDSTLPGWSPAAKSEQPSQPGQQVVDDAAFSALTSFARQIGAEQPQSAGVKTSQSSDLPFDDQTYAGLRDFAQRIGAAQPQSIKDLPQTAEADNLLDFLQQRGSGSPAPDKATSPAAASKKSGAPVDAHFVGSKACQTCHSPLIAEFDKTLMGKISHTPQGRGKFECENCHGPGSAHVKAGGGRGVGGIMGFGSNDPRTVEERNGICLACHQKGERNYWAGSVHETRGVACTNCHSVMKNVSRKHNLKTVVEKETCFQCHKLERAQIQYSSHMPLRENKITCTNCHNPHGTVTEKLIREATVNQNCYKCHAEKRGPMLYEHIPVRENCLNCHNPHGSNYENLLKVARPRLCNECHTTVHNPAAGGGFGPASPGTVYRLQNGCGNCHSNIHGSNHPNGMFFLR